MSLRKSHKDSLYLFYTTRLCERSSYISGLASIFNIAGNYSRFNYSKTPEEADMRAIAADWEVTAEDLKKAIKYFRLKYNLHVDAPSTSDRGELADSASE